MTEMINWTIPPQYWKFETLSVVQSFFRVAHVGREEGIPEAVVKKYEYYLDRVVPYTNVDYTDADNYWQRTFKKMPKAKTANVSLINQTSQYIRSFHKESQPFSYNRCLLVEKELRDLLPHDSNYILRVKGFFSRRKKYVVYHDWAVSVETPISQDDLTLLKLSLS